MSRSRRSALADVPVTISVSQDASPGDISALLDLLIQWGLQPLQAAPSDAPCDALAQAPRGDVTPLKLHRPDEGRMHKPRKRRAGKPKRPAPASPPARKKREPK